MQMESVDVNTPAPKLAYEKPCLVSYGDLRTITKSGARGSADGAGSAGHSMPCWVAEVLYGKHDPRTQILRCWLMQVYAQTVAGSLIVVVYRAVGRNTARLAKSSGAIRMILQPLFDAGVRRAQRHYWAAR
jgi:hypothetical protein